MKLCGKIIRYAQGDRISLGFLENNYIAPLDCDDIHQLFTTKCNQPQASDFSICLDEVELLSPFQSPKQDVLCLGANFLDHAKESMRYKKIAFDGKRPNPIYFSKRVNFCNHPNGTFYWRGDHYIDYEVELVVIIGKDCFGVRQEDAYEYIFGYSITNDITARNLQQKYQQWSIAKSLEGSFPLGPCIVLRDCLDVSNLEIKSYVNGELRQHSNTSQFIFDIAYVIEDLSSHFMLKAGTLIAMGTPSGVGMGFDPPLFLKDGDVVKCEIEGIGELITHFKNEK